jgi:sugar lactone lactonase YvrE
MAIDTSGNLYISEEGNNDIRKIDRLTGIVHTICGNGGGGYYGDNGPATDAHMELPAGICVDRAGNVYIADYGNQRVRKINVATGMISTFAGNGISGYTGDNGAATAAELSYPKAVCADTAGNIYIADYGNNCIRKVNAATGAITTFAGITTAGYYGDNGPAVNAALRQPNALFMSKQGNLFISDWGNNVIRAVSRAGNIYTVAGTGAVGYTGDNGPALDATFRGPLALCSDDAGYLYIADGESSAIRRVSPIAVGIQELEQHLKVTVYPNPSQGKFTVYTGQAADATLTLYNDMGQVTYTARCNDERTFVDASNLSPGVYFLNFTAADKRITQKIIINP